MLMDPTIAPFLKQLADDGYCVIPAVYPAKRVETTLREMEAAFARDTNGSTLRSADGSIYGARNLLQMWSDAADAWKQPLLVDFLKETLGLCFGLVRILYFDKPPEQSWALPWHKDRTIAVQNNRLPSNHFCKPTFKVGVPHVEAPEWLLENMLTLRMHLDDMTEANGPLKIVPRSHQSGNENHTPATIVGPRGDALLMRPLISHCSAKSVAHTKQHRRILHYEFAGTKELPDGYVWHDFVPVVT